MAYGIQAQAYTVLDYELQLLERGFIRSGSYTYQPDNIASCCPNIPIRLCVARRVEAALRAGLRPVATSAAIFVRAHRRRRLPRCPAGT